MSHDFDKEPFNKQPIWYDMDLIKAAALGVVLGFVVGLFVGYDLGYEPVVKTVKYVVG